MLYSSTEIDDILLDADTTLYKLQEKSDMLKLYGDTAILDDELLLIYSLKKTVKWSRDKDLNNVLTHNLASYLKHKIDGYGFNGTIPYYAAVNNVSSSTGASESGFQFYVQWEVGIGDAPIIGSTTKTDTNLIGRFIIMYADGVLLPVGVSNPSYTFNQSTGQITWNYPLPAGQVLTLFTYIPSLSGWDLFLDTTVGGGTISNGATTYTSASLIGKGVAVVVDGFLLPIGLAGAFSITFNTLTGTVTWNTALTTGQQVQIYTY
jgi:hypothetical protein